jgi:hypothetical protein
VLLLAMPSHAEILPSFILLNLAWTATDIVVVSEGRTLDGTVTVLAVWEGGLAVGDTITVPQLREFASPESRTVSDLWRRPDEKKPPVVVPSTRMVLFLKRTSRAAIAGEEAGRVDWRAASHIGGMKVAVAWIADGRVYAHVQVMNPGPCVFTAQRYSESEMMIEVDRIVTERNLLRRVRALGDDAARARQAAKHVGSSWWRARDEAFSILGDCGEAAMAPLHQLLTDDSKVSLHKHAVKALAAAGGPRVAAELTQMVEDELRFWKEEAPGLRYGWWNGNGIKWARVWPLRERYSIGLQVVYGLKEIRSPVCRDAVTLFRDYWRSLPQLQDGVGLQMSRACDAVLRALPRQPEAVEPSRATDAANE